MLPECSRQIFIAMPAQQFSLLSQAMHYASYFRFKLLDFSAVSISRTIVTKDHWVPDYHETIVHANNKPIGNAHLLAGTWWLTLSVKLCQQCYFLSSRPLYSSV